MGPHDHTGSKSRSNPVPHALSNHRSYIGADRRPFLCPNVITDHDGQNNRVSNTCTDPAADISSNYLGPYTCPDRAAILKSGYMQRCP